MSTNHPFHKSNITSRTCFGLLESPFDIDVHHSVGHVKEKDSGVGGSLMLARNKETGDPTYIDSSNEKLPLPDGTVNLLDPEFNGDCRSNTESLTYNKVSEEGNTNSQLGQDFHNHRHEYQSPEIDLQLQYILQTIFQDGFNDLNDDSGMKAKRKRASPEQLRILNLVFQHTFFPSTELRSQLARHLRMSPRAVQIWFQNKRQSWKLSKQKRVDNTQSVTRSPSPYPIRDSTPVRSCTMTPQLPSFSEIANLSAQLSINSIHTSSEAQGEDRNKPTHEISQIRIPSSHSRTSATARHTQPVLPPLQQVSTKSISESHLPQLPPIDHIIQQNFALP